MFKTSFAATVLAVASLVPATLHAGGLKMPLKAPDAEIIQARSVQRTPTVMPPANYKGQWWTHPAGCQYSRAGRPGEVVWFLTSIPKGATCPEFIQQKATDYIYRKPFMIDG